MSLLRSIRQQLGLMSGGNESQNHFWDGSVPNQLSLKRGVPDAPGATVMQVVDGTPNVTTLQLGRNADAAKNFKITVPAVEDGTLTIERGDGTDVMKFLANGGVDMPSLPFLKAADGYMTLPNGLIIQWGALSAAVSANSQTIVPVTFPVQFQNAPFRVIMGGCAGTVGLGFTMSATALSETKTGFSAYISSEVAQNATSSWIAIGY